MFSRRYSGMAFKCFSCFSIVETDPCPVCGQDGLDKMCRLDRPSCGHDIVEGIEFCPECHHAVCPICKCHDVVQVSRVTGYLSEVSGWNRAKQQELKDRKRYQIS